MRMTTTTARPSTRNAGDRRGVTRTRQNHVHRKAGRPMARYPNSPCTAQRAGTANFGLMIAVGGGTVINTISNGNSQFIAPRCAMNYFNLVSAHAIRALDANGDSVSGALLRVYTAGTTTAETTYTSAAGTTANAWPVVLDAAGALDTGLYVLPGEYKVDLQTPQGASLPGYPVDNVIVTGGEDFSRADLATSTIDAATSAIRTNG